MRSVSVLLLLLATAIPANSGPLLQYDFDGGDGDVVEDAGAGSHDGKITGATWTAHGEGKSLTFKGPDYDGPAKPPGTFVRVEGSEGLNPSKGVEVTASIYPTFNPVAWGGIVEKGVGYGSSFRLVMLRSGKVRATIGNEHAAVDSPEPVPLDAWTSLKLSFDGSRLKLYVNDKVAAEASATTSKLSTESPIEIGRRFTGQIDDVKISY